MTKPEIQAMPKLPANKLGKEKNICFLFYKPRHQSQTHGQVREVQRRMEHTCQKGQ